VSYFAVAERLIDLAAANVLAWRFDLANFDVNLGLGG